MSIYTKKRIAVYLLLSLLLVTVYTFQTVSATGIEIFGIKPFMLIPAVICVTLSCTLPQSVAFSVILGLACDAVSGVMFGKYALLLMITACVVRFVSENAISDGIIAALIYQVSIYIVLTVYKLFWKIFIIGSTFGLGTEILGLWIECIYSSIFAIPVFLFCKWMKGKFGQDE